MAITGLSDSGIVVNPDGPSASARVVLAACQGVIRPLLRVLPITRATIPIGAVAIDALASLRPLPQGIDREQVRLKGFRMEIIRPAAARAQGPEAVARQRRFSACVTTQGPGAPPIKHSAARALRHGAVMYMHGGGFAVCGLGTHRPVAASLARRTGLPVVNVDYRQLPGRTISDSIEDCLTAYRWLLRRGADPARIIFAGDSAGGFLSFATALRAVELGLPAPAGLVGLSPLLDLDYSAKRDYLNVARDPYIPLSALAAVVRIGGEIDGRLDPLLSPINGALASLPPVLMIAAEDEVLRYDAALMADRLTAAGVPNSLELWRGQVHAFTSIFPNLPEGRAALGRVARFVRARLEYADRTAEQARTA